MKIKTAKATEVTTCPKATEGCKSGDIISDDAIEDSFQALVDEVNDDLEYTPTEAEDLSLAEWIR